MLIPFRNTGADAFPGRHENALLPLSWLACVQARRPLSTKSASITLSTYSSFRMADTSRAIAVPDGYCQKLRENNVLDGYSRQ